MCVCVCKSFAVVLHLLSGTSLLARSLTQSRVGFGVAYLAWPLNVLESVLYRACRVLGIERLRCPASQALIQSMTMYLYNRDSINV